jgi:hypothetical protein
MGLLEGERMVAPAEAARLAAALEEDEKDDQDDKNETDDRGE